MTVVTNRHPKCNRLMMNIYQKNKSFQIKKTFKSPAMLKTYMSALYMPSHWLRALLFWDRDVWLAGLPSSGKTYVYRANFARVQLVRNRKRQVWGRPKFDQIDQHFPTFLKILVSVRSVRYKSTSADQENIVIIYVFCSFTHNSGKILIISHKCIKLQYLIFYYVFDFWW